MWLWKTVSSPKIIDFGTVSLALDQQSAPSAPKSLQTAFIGAVSLVLLAALAVWFFSGSSQAPQDQTQADEAASSDTAPVSPVPAVVDIAPSFDVVRISRGGTGVIAGRAAPGAEVAILKNGVEIGRLMADRSGEWVFILETPLSPGAAELSLVAQNGDDTDLISGEVVVVAVPEAEPEKFLSSQADGVVAILSPRDGAGASRVLQKPGTSAPDEGLHFDSLDYGDTPGQPAVLTGRAPPQSDLRLYFDDQLVGDIRADETGRWQVLMDDLPGQGDHVIRADLISDDAQVSLRVEQPVTIGVGLDPALADAQILVRPGNSLWQIARRVYGSGYHFTLIFKENSEKILDPDLIYPGQVFRIPNQASRQDG